METHNEKEKAHSSNKTVAFGTKFWRMWQSKNLAFSS
jgi:hypothetical protein